MFGRWVAMTALVALMGCAGLEPVGRTAQREGAISQSAPEMPPPRATLPPPTRTTSPPPMREVTPVPPPPPLQTSQPAVAAAHVGVEPPPPPRDPSDVIVHGSAPEQQVQAPNGDPRSLGERREDIQSWDHCVMQVMAQQGDPNRVSMDSPEDICSHRLGQASRNALPQSRIQQPRP